MKTIFQNARIVGRNVNASDYIKSDHERGNPALVMSRSQLIEFSRCPHRWLMGFGENDDTKSTEWGNLIDCLLLEPQKFESRYAVAPLTYPCDPTKKDPRTEKPWNKNSNWCEAWEIEQEKIGKTVVTLSLKNKAKKAVASILEHPTAGEIVGCSEKQVMIIAEYHDKATGLVIPVKCLIDLEPRCTSRFGGWLGDLKTSLTACPQRWARLVNERGYETQGAFFSDLHHAATGEQRETWFHIVQENYAPYEVMSPLPILSAEYMEIGRTKYLNALKQYAHCLKTGEWPSYPTTRMVMDGCQVIEPDAYMIGRATDQLWEGPQEEQSEEQETLMPN